MIVIISFKVIWYVFKILVILFIVNLFKYVKYIEVVDKKYVRNVFIGEVVGEIFIEWWKCILMFYGVSGEIYDECVNDVRCRMCFVWNVCWVFENL